jgi:Xaa-Pro aminopeptidase
MQAPVQPDWAGRLARLQSALSAHSVDALVLSSPQSIRYVTGFAGSAGLVVIAADRAILITDGRYETVVRQELSAGRLGPVTLERVARRYDLALGEVVVRLGLGRVGFEAGHVTVATLGAWGRASGQTVWVATERLVEGMRLLKDDGEIAIMRKGARMISEVACQLGGIVKRGKTERAVAGEIERALERVGFSAPAFPTIVASGPNSALPHAHPTDRALAPNDLVVLDFGGVIDGYCLDLTRMAAVGAPSERGMALFTAVRAAHEAAIRAIRPGMLTSDVDAAARSVLETYGFGEAFVHSTGHGLGLDVHEAPRLGRPDPDAPETVEAGMVFTIEPGAYLEGIGGVRLEDDVFVVATGCEVLTTAPLDLLVV